MARDLNEPNLWTGSLNTTDLLEEEAVLEIEAVGSDIRSASRYGMHDFGTNAERIRDFYSEVNTALEKGEKTVLEGPLRLEASYGDVFEGVLLDRVDPSLAELKFFPPP